MYGELGPSGIAGIKYETRESRYSEGQQFGHMN